MLKYIRIKRFLLPLFLSIIFACSACGPDEKAPTPEEREYGPLNELGSIYAGFAGAINETSMEFDELLSDLFIYMEASFEGDMVIVPAEGGEEPMPDFSTAVIFVPRGAAPGEDETYAIIDEFIEKQENRRVILDAYAKAVGDVYMAAVERDRQ